MKAEKADSIKMFVKRNLILARVEEHARALQTQDNAKVERMVTLTDAMVKIIELLESGRSINRS